MEGAQPYRFSSEASRAATTSVGSDTMFDPFTVLPAFARTPWDHPHHSGASQSSVTPTASRRNRLVVPALGDASLMGELPTTDPLSILVQKHLAPHVRPVRDLSGSWYTPSSFTVASNQTNNIGGPATEIPDPFASVEHQGYASETLQVINPDNVYQAATTNAWRRIATLARTKLENYANQEQQRINHEQQTRTQLIETAQSDEDQVEGMEVYHVLQWWSIRLYCLARLRLYSMLRTELAALWQVLSTTRVDQGDGEVMLADTQHVPFTLRVLRATEPKFRDDIRTTVEQYTLLIHLCKQHIKQLGSEARQSGTSSKGDQRQEVWKRRALRVGLMLAFTLAEAKDYRGAIEVLEPVVEKALNSGEEVGLESRLQFVVVASRVWVQAGNLEAAQTLLDRALKLVPSTSCAVERELDHSYSLIAAIKGDFSTASTHFSTYASSRPSTIAQQLNHAIVDFYSAKLDESIQRLEQVLEHDPALFASADAVVFNTATLYELAAGGEREVMERKRVLLAKVARWVGEPGVNSSVFKL